MTARRASRPSEAPPSSARFIPVAAALAALVATSYSQPLAVAEHEWLAFDGPASATVTFETRIPAQWDHVEGPQGRGALRVLVPSMDTDEKACAFHLPLRTPEGSFNAVRLWLRGAERTRHVEVVFRTPDGNYGKDLPLGPEWNEVMLRARDARPLLGTQVGSLDLARVTEVRFCFGAWQGHTGGPHEVSIGPVTAVHDPLAEPVAPPESIEHPDVPLPPQPFTVELLDIARGRWRFDDDLGQTLPLDGSVDAQVYPGTATGDPRLAYLCCDPEFPEDLRHAVLRVVSPVGREGDSLAFGIEEPYFACTVTARQAPNGAYLCELRDVTLGPARQGDRYVAGLYLLVGEQACPLRLVPEGGDGLQVRLTTDRVGHVFSGSEPVTVFLSGLCPDSAQTCALELKLTDYATGEVLWEGSQALACDAGACTEAALSLPLERFGVFELTAEGAPQPVKLRLCRVPEPRKVEPEASTIGINIFQQQVWWYAYQVPMMAKVGVHWIRPWLAWENVWSTQQPSADTWDTRALDAALRRMAMYDMEYQAILFGAPQWVTGKAGWSAPPEDRLDLWSQYVRRLVEQYKDRIRYWEMWNEPDLMWQDETRHSGAHYVAVLKAGWEAAKAADPDCTVLGLSHAGYMDWLENVGRTGAKDYFDIATLHSYAPPADYSDAIRQRREVLNRYGMADKPVWMNELGATAYDFSPEYSAKYSCSELKQASVLTANYALSLADDPRMKAFWFCTYDPRDPSHESDWTWDAGIGVLYLGFLPKLSYAALAGVSQELDGRECLGQTRVTETRLPDKALGLHQVSFSGPLALVWSDHPERAAEVPATELGCLAEERIELRDAYTNPVVSRRAGDVVLDLSRGPVYLEGSAQLAGIAQAERATRVESEKVTVSPGASVRVGVEAPEGADLSAEMQPGVAATAEVNAARQGEWAVVVSAPEGAQRGAGIVTVRARLAAGTMGLAAPVTVERRLSVSIGEPNLLRDGGLQASNLSQWTPERTSAYSWDGTTGHVAPGSLRLDAPFDRRLVHWGLQPVVGKPMRVSAWVKTRDLGGGLVTLNMAFFGADKWLGSWTLAASGPTGEREPNWGTIAEPGRIPSGTTDWALVEAELPGVDVPEGTVKAAFYIDAAEGGAGSVWFDDLDLWQPEGGETGVGR